MRNPPGVPATVQREILALAIDFERRPDAVVEAVHGLRLRCRLGGPRRDTGACDRQHDECGRCEPAGAAVQGVLE